MTQPMPDPGFLADVRRAASVWRGNPVVPLVYVLFAVVTFVARLLTPSPPTECARKVFGQCPLPPDQVHAASLRNLLLLPLFLFYVGLSGTARVWYVRRFRGDVLSGREVWQLSWRFFWRFVRLGFLFFAVALPLSIPAFVLLQRDHSTAGTVLLVLDTIVVDLLFTFVTPGVALYNGKAWQSFVGGVKVLRTTWPRCAAYALVPPLGLTLAGQALSAGRHDHRVLSSIASLLGPPLTLLFAGAVTGFLIRRHPPKEPYGTAEPKPVWRADLQRS